MIDYAAKFELWLRAAYAYYILCDEIMGDVEWDMLGRDLSRAWDEWDHPDKGIVRRDEMFTGYYLQFAYPQWVKDSFA
jgi:hypothetical protein